MHIQSVPTRKIYILYNVVYIYIGVLAHTVLYTIVLHTNEGEHTVPLEALGSTAGLPLQKKEAVIDEEVVWLHKGKTVQGYYS